MRAPLYATRRQPHAHRESRLELLLFPVVLLAVIFLLAVAPVR